MKPTARTELTAFTRGLDPDCYPYRLWRKAKLLGTWNPEAIDFDQDRRDWSGLSEAERTALIFLTVRFIGGEESVLHDLLPLMLYISREGSLEEEMYLASFQWEEAKHLDGFSTYMSEILQQQNLTQDSDDEGYRTLYYVELPNALNRLLHDPSPEALAEAVVTYHMISEGTLVETGYHIYYQLLENRGIMPGLQQMVRLVQRDEARHIAFGVYLLSRLVAEHGDPMWALIDRRMSELVKVANLILLEGIGAFSHLRLTLDIDAFGLINFGYAQFLKRRNRIEKARRQTIKEVYYGRYGEDLTLPADQPQPS